MTTQVQPHNVSYFRFEESAIFKGYLIAPVGNVYRVLDPIGGLALKSFKTVDEAKEEIVELEIHSYCYEQIQTWLYRGLISESQAEEMRADVDEATLGKPQHEN